MVAKCKQSSESLPVAALAEDKVSYEAELKEHKAQMEKKNAEKLEQEVSDARNEPWCMRCSFDAQTALGVVLAARAGRSKGASS